MVINVGRPSRESIFLEMAKILSRRTTCRRRAVGCILVDKNNHVLATGYNGVGSGLSHCIETPCDGARYPSGTGLDKCEAIHAEQNALLQCKNVQEIETAYITCSPCIHCAKLFLNTGVKTIYCESIYQNGYEAVDLLRSKGIKVELCQTLS